MTDAAKTYVILVNYNGWEDTLNCIESLRLMQYPNFEVIVVDNCSVDESVRRLGERLDVVEVAATSISGYVPRDSAIDNGDLPSVVIIKSEENHGFAGGNNLAIRYVLDRGDADYVWLLNNDTVVHRDALSELVVTIEGQAESSTTVAMCGSLILDFEQRSKVQAYGGARVNPFLGMTRNLHAGETVPDSGHSRSDETPDYISGCSLLVRRECIEVFGLLDEYYFLYWEDTEWCYRCKKHGFGLAVAEKSLIWHRRGSTTKRFPISGYYNARNCLLFIREYYPAYLISCLVLKPLIFFAILVRNRDYSYFRASLRGYAKFLRAGLLRRDVRSEA